MSYYLIFEQEFLSIIAKDEKKKYFSLLLEADLQVTSSSSVSITFTNKTPPWNS